MASRVNHRPGKLHPAPPPPPLYVSIYVPIHIHTHIYIHTHAYSGVPRIIQLLPLLSYPFPISWGEISCKEIALLLSWPSYHSTVDLFLISNSMQGEYRVFIFKLHRIPLTSFVNLGISSCSTSSTFLAKWFLKYLLAPTFYVFLSLSNYFQC